MPIDYTVRSVSANSIIVDFDNGQWAAVPVSAGMSKADIKSRIQQFAFFQQSYSDSRNVPMQAGEKGTLLSPDELRESHRYTYAEIRLRNYPSIGDQLDAAYWARQGNLEAQKAMDAAIEEVKRTVPKDAPPMTLAEASELALSLMPPINEMPVDELIAQLEAPDA